MNWTTNPTIERRLRYPRGTADRLAGSVFLSFSRVTASRRRTAFQHGQTPRTVNFLRSASLRHNVRCFATRLPVNYCILQYTNCILNLQLHKDNISFILNCWNPLRMGRMSWRTVSFLHCAQTWWRMGFDVKLLYLILRPLFSAKKRQSTIYELLWIAKNKKGN